MLLLATWERSRSTRNNLFDHRDGLRIMYWLSLERKKKLSYNRRGLRTTELRHQILNFQSRYQALSPCLPLTREGERGRESVCLTSLKWANWALEKRRLGTRSKKVCNGYNVSQASPSFPHKGDPRGSFLSQESTPGRRCFLLMLSCDHMASFTTWDAGIELWWKFAVIQYRVLGVTAYYSSFTGFSKTIIFRCSDVFLSLVRVL